jgi:hypothetical protein
LFTLIAGSSPARRPGERRNDNTKKNPALRRDFPALAWFTSELAIGLLAGITVLALTIRVLLLLAGLLPAALLTLLAGLLTRVLILLARILVLVGHGDLLG